MPVNWKTQESVERLLTALFASIGSKADYNAIAHYFGQGTTFNSIELNFRRIRKDAEKLKEETGQYDGRKVLPTMTKKRNAASASKANGNGVMTGRVTKKSPAKRRSAQEKVEQLVKKELDDNDDSINSTATELDEDFDSGFGMDGHDDILDMV